MALHHYPLAEIFNSDQGAQFTAAAFTGYLHVVGLQISMDGRSRCHHSIFVERLWSCLKYELIYLKAFDDSHHLKQEMK